MFATIFPLNLPKHVPPNSGFSSVAITGAALRYETTGEKMRAYWKIIRAVVIRSLSVPLPCYEMSFCLCTKNEMITQHYQGL